MYQMLSFAPYNISTTGLISSKLTSLETFALDQLFKEKNNLKKYELFFYS